MGTDSVAVCVCTRDRPVQLQRLLESFCSLQRPVGTMFVIIENGSGDARTKELVAEFRARCGSKVEYEIEPRPGISAARNTAIAVARKSGASIAAMLDDDEWPCPGWLLALLEMRARTGASIIGGPVRPVFKRHKRHLRKYEMLWSVQKGSLRGRLHVYCTCNCLLDLAAIAFLGGESFPEEFGLTGGEDVVFFRRLHFAGVSMAWADEAIVFEEVPEERASLAWIRRRWYRHGNTGVRCELAAPDPEGPSPALKTVLLCMRLPFYPLFSRRVWRAPWIWLFEAEKIRGRIASHLGHIRADYDAPPKIPGAVT